MTSKHRVEPNYWMIYNFSCDGVMRLPPTLVADNLSWTISCKGIIHLHEYLVVLKNQEDEIVYREVINDDGIYDIRVMNALPKQVLAVVTKL